MVLDNERPEADAQHWCISSRVTFIILPDIDEVMIIGSKMLHESLDIVLVGGFHQRKSEVGEMLNAHAEESVSSLRRVSELGLTLQRMLQSQAEDGFRDPPEFRDVLVLYGPVVLKEVGEEVVARREALVGTLPALVSGRVGGYRAGRIRVSEGPYGWPPARVTPMQVTFMQGTDLLK